VYVWQGVFLYFGLKRVFDVMESLEVFSVKSTFEKSCL
jgi:hypothetical protein